jgi:hypothetical protein
MRNISTAPFVVPKAKPPSAEKLNAKNLTIQGQQAGSLLEYFISVAFDILKVRYAYQVPVGGGRSIRGGTVIDFLAYTVPLPTPIYAQGTYWHGDAHKRESDQWMMRRIRSLMNYQVTEPLEIWEHEAATIAQATATVREKLHV